MKMKKLTTLLAAAAMLCGAVFAEDNPNAKKLFIDNEFKLNDKGQLAAWTLNEAYKPLGAFTAVPGKSITLESQDNITVIYATAKYRAKIGDQFIVKGKMSGDGDGTFCLYIWGMKWEWRGAIYQFAPVGEEAEFRTQTFTIPDWAKGRCRVSVGLSAGKDSAVTFSDLSLEYTPKQ